MQQLASIIYDTWFSVLVFCFFFCCFFFLKDQHLFTTVSNLSRSVRERVQSDRLKAYDEACFLTVATFKTIYEGFFKRRSVTNTANFFHSSGD